MLGNFNTELFHALGSYVNLMVALDLFIYLAQTGLKRHPSYRVDIVT